MMPLVIAWILHARSSASGASVSTPPVYLVLKIGHATGGQRVFPPGVIVEVKALACELPSRRGLPLARWSLAELRREVVAQGLVAQISGTTLRRWLSQDALRPGAVGFLSKPFDEEALIDCVETALNDRANHADA
jgi:hypothetical protein